MLGSSTWSGESLLRLVDIGRRSVGTRSLAGGFAIDTHRNSQSCSCYIKCRLEGNILRLPSQGHWLAIDTHYISLNISKPTGKTPELRMASVGCVGYYKVGLLVVG